MALAPLRTHTFPSCNLVRTIVIHCRSFWQSLGMLTLQLTREGRKFVRKMVDHEKKESPLQTLTYFWRYRSSLYPPALNRSERLPLRSGCFTLQGKNPRDSLGLGMAERSIIMALVRNLIQTLRVVHPVT